MIITIDSPSPNFDSRKNAPITMLVLHYTGMRNVKEAMDRLRNPEAKVSAHYLVEQSGTVYQMVEESNRAWHAGVSFWRGVTDVNAHSIGIELVNKGHEFGYEDFPPAQMKSVIDLCRDIISRHPTIEARNVVAHSDVAPERKQDPGEKFNWRKLANNGIGLWPEAEAKPNAANLDIGEVQRKLKLYGYDVDLTATLDEKTRAVITAFQRHFRPKLLTGTWDAECDGLLVDLLVKVA